ncbi:PucR family transcriptional regulator [Streptomyces sp. 7-21]|uniref:PucR family transcriptional regulator n=1 Tax=Streptomyces sp. 7-21 TaxID=2802283 RepID=UPI001920349D|nr:PucR family transcriptional regulator [Streptomyces sp. 7-21]MBL1067013.1 PucR family transcriptional regulator [Streptomyces sp. 7-21]
MRVRALLGTAGLGLTLLAGEAALDRPLRGVMTTDLRDPGRYLSGGELVLTGLAWWRGPADAEPFVRVLTRAGVAALAAGTAEFGEVPPALTEVCTAYRLPLFAVAEEVSFATITEHVTRRLSAARAGDLAAVVERHRRLVAAGLPGGGPGAVLGLLGSDLDLAAWVVSAAGALVADSGCGPLPETTAARLAARHAAAEAAGRAAPFHVVAGAGGPYSLFPVGGGPAWALVVRADAREWHGPRRELMASVARFLTQERERHEAGRAAPRRLAGEVLALAAADAPPAETAARLRAAATVLAPGLAAPRWQVVAARCGGGRDAGAALEELLAAAGTPGTACADAPGTGPQARPERAAGAAECGEQLALVPLPPATADGPAPLRAAALLRAARGPLTAWFGSRGGLSLGVSAAVATADALCGALTGARHALRVAASRPGPVAAADDGDLASHALLLPFLPGEVRRGFAARLLGPVRAYDQRNGAALLPTLAAFLAADGSWTRCAAALHLHVNTVRYRIGCVERLTGRDLSRLEDRVDFFLALRLA